MPDVTYLSPILIGVVEVLKRLGLPSKYSPVVAVVMGVGLSFALNLNPSVSERTLEGVIAGLAAVGLYSGTRATVEVLRGGE